MVGRDAKPRGWCPASRGDHAWPAPAAGTPKRDAARRALEEARDSLARLLGVDRRAEQPDQLIFTSGATEANHLALRGLAGEQPGRIIISSIEHPSVVGAAEHLARRG